MATRSRATFQKRQKEMMRQEKQRMKAEIRARKKLARAGQNAANGELAENKNAALEKIEVESDEPGQQI